jgi:hypothetical protein
MEDGEAVEEFVREEFGKVRHNFREVMNKVRTNEYETFKKLTVSKSKEESDEIYEQMDE